MNTAILGKFGCCHHSLTDQRCIYGSSTPWLISFLHLFQKKLIDPKFQSPQLEDSRTHALCRRRSHFHSCVKNCKWRLWLLQYRFTTAWFVCIHHQLMCKRNEDKYVQITATYTLLRSQVRSDLSHSDKDVSYSVTSVLQAEMQRPAEVQQTSLIQMTAVVIWSYSRSRVSTELMKTLRCAAVTLSHSRGRAALGSGDPQRWPGPCVPVLWTSCWIGVSPGQWWLWHTGLSWTNDDLNFKQMLIKKTFSQDEFNQITIKMLWSKWSCYILEQLDRNVDFSVIWNYTTMPLWRVFFDWIRLLKLLNGAIDRENMLL